MTAAEQSLEIFLTRTFKAPRALVYRIWTTEDEVQRWWGPKDFVVPFMAWDFRVGGSFRAQIKRPDMEAWHGGRFIEIVPEERIRFTFAWEEGSGPTNETTITVTFEARGDLTVQTFHQTNLRDVATRDSHIGGWSEFLDREENYVLTGKAQ